MAPFARLTAPTEVRPWGGFQDLFEAQGFKVKLLEIEPGKRLSLQRHRKRDEHWVVVEGRGRIRVGHQERPIGRGNHEIIPCGRIHRVTNDGDVPLVILELQLGECREDDIERLADDFGRK